ncbi:hypothetical protein CDL12_23443 [Handroanthus impetiginosus]|uniref:Uncharacterized protein n=1 Tax=Handroanthus impetiginosus TaxID=429701 RepID=A0A2G9GFR1_9LAMI|nr:hypothetical protein CDL12_23443 [Handroanthus impetiginosus]
MILNCAILKVLRSILSSTLKAHGITTQTHIKTDNSCTHIREKPSLFSNQARLRTTSLHNLFDFTIAYISNSFPSMRIGYILYNKTKER